MLKHYLTHSLTLSLLLGVSLVALTPYAHAEEESDTKKEETQKPNNDGPPTYISYGSQMQGWTLLKGVDSGKVSGDNDDSDRVLAMEKNIRLDIEEKQRRDEQHTQDILAKEKQLESDQSKVFDSIHSLYHKDNQLTSERKRSKEEVEEGINHMARTYENMAPKSAAAMFDIIDMRVMVPIAQHMNSRKLSVVMGNMNIDRANILSQYLAGIKQLSGDTMNRIGLTDDQNQQTPNQQN